LLGPSILFASPPFCTGYAWYAVKNGGAKAVGRVGFALAAVELLAAISLIIVGLIIEPTTSRI
jgi:hypothetical protein